MVLQNFFIEKNTEYGEQPRGVGQLSEMNVILWKTATYTYFFINIKKANSNWRGLIFDSERQIKKVIARIIFVYYICAKVREQKRFFLKLFKL